MKSKEEMMDMLMSTLGDLQSGCTESNPEVHIWLQHRLEFLADVLGDEVPAEVTEQIKDVLDK